MAAGKLISKSVLQEWIANFLTNKNLGSTTNSVSISISQLENYIAEAKAKYPSGISGIKFYFIRYPLAEGLPALPHLEKAGQNLSQPSMVMVPVGKYNAGSGGGEDLTVPGQNDLYVLAFGSPDTDPNDATSLCPPKCG